MTEKTSITMEKTDTVSDRAEKLNKALKKQPALFREFSEFINRGSVIDLAVGVIVGGAFSKIVTSLVDDIIMPLIGTIGGGVDLSNLEITVNNPVHPDQAAHITYGNFLQNVIDFLIVAFCIFLFVRLINKISFRKKKEEEAKKKEEAAKKANKVKVDEETLAVLKDIRATLKKSQK